MYNKGGLVESKTNYVKNSAGVKTLASKFTYTFNCNGSVRSESSEIPGQSGILKEYVYDGAGRLSAETQTSTADNTVLYSGSFTYDRNGNRLTSTNTADGQSVTTVYTYDKNNRLTSTQTGSDVTLYTYDANGNTLMVGNKTYTYDEYNRQKRYEVDGSSKGVYEYSANGLRSVKNGRGLIWLGDKMVYEFGIGNGVRGTVYTYGFGIATADGETSYLKNAHGDVVQLVKNGAVVKNYRYNAFGEEIGIDENPFRYCGEYYDAESGTIYLRARYYNPANGRFTTLDPAMDGINWYVYCANNPILFVDPWGRLSIFSMIKERNAGIKKYGRDVTSVAIRTSNTARNNAVDYARKNGMYNDVKHTFRIQGEVDHYYTRELVTWDNAADAMRHSQWNYLMAKEIGVSEATFFGNQHELLGLQENGMVTKIDGDVVCTKMNQATVMDLWNNEVGRSLAGTMADSTEAQMFDYAMDNNLLITDATQVYEKLGLKDYINTEDWTITVTWNMATGKLTVSKPGLEDKEIEIGKKE